MSERWLEISVRVAESELDDVQTILARWVGTNQSVEQVIRPAAAAPAHTTVRAYLPEGPECAATRFQIVQALWHLGATGAPGLRQPAERWLDAATFLNGWREHYAPLPLGQGFLVVPSWLDAPPTSRTVIRMDPGMAFGTGMHPSTRLTAAALEAAVEPGDQVIDVGTGSGILSIMAVLAGAGRVLALDVDRVAARIAAQNLAANGRASLACVAVGSVDAVASRSADVLVANIVASVHLQQLTSYRRVLVADGALILGGIVAERAVEVADAAEAQGFVAVDTREQVDWVTISFAPDSIGAPRSTAHPAEATRAD
jgi:ribosomal protein L11 methyltransferase